MPEVLICRRDEVKDGDVRIIEIGEVELGVIRHQGCFFAYRNRCPHQGGPACEGLRIPQVIDRIGDEGEYLGQAFDEGDMHLICPWHGYEFHLTTGIHVTDERVRLRKITVIEREGNVYVDV
jgi:nitrite reductase (NADH) small subunit